MRGDGRPGGGAYVVLSILLSIDLDVPVCCARLRVPATGTRTLPVGAAVVFNSKLLSEPLVVASESGY